MYDPRGAITPAQSYCTGCCLHSRCPRLLFWERYRANDYCGRLALQFRRLFPSLMKWIRTGKHVGFKQEKATAKTARTKVKFWRIPLREPCLSFLRFPEVGKIAPFKPFQTFLGVFWINVNFRLFKPSKNMSVKNARSFCLKFWQDRLKIL